MPKEKRSFQCFCKDIGHVVFAGEQGDLNRVVGNALSDVVIPYVDMLDVVVGCAVARETDGSPIVRQQGRGSSG